MTHRLDDWTERFTTRRAHVAVVGLGYVGLPLAVAFAQAGYRVTGIDVDGEKVAAINRGDSYVEDIPAAQIAALVGHDHPAGDGAAGSLRATTDFAMLAQCDAVSICVPTPLNKTGEPDISYIVSSSEQIARHLHRGMVVVLESTTYPGTTREVLLPILEKGGGERELGRGDGSAPIPEHDMDALRHSQSLIPGQDFFLAFSPERIDPGRTDWTVQTMPKVLGGVTAACTRVAAAFYAPAVGPLITVRDPETAELTKLFENTFRSVNIALANELLLMCDQLGLDAWEVIDAAATKPFGFMKFTPGPGLGGHCIPIDPEYLSWKLRTLQYRARFIELAGEINTQMPRYWVQKVQDALNQAGKAVKGSRILVLGVAYKKNVSDTRESPALDIIHLLRTKGAEVTYHDPFVPRVAYEGVTLTCAADLPAAVRAVDCVVIATDHDAYDWTALAADAQMIVDTRHVLEDQTEAPMLQPAFLHSNPR